MTLEPCSWMRVLPRPVGTAARTDLPAARRETVSSWKGFRVAGKVPPDSCTRQFQRYNKLMLISGSEIHLKSVDMLDMLPLRDKQNFWVSSHNISTLVEGVKMPKFLSLLNDPCSLKKNNNIL